MTLATSRIMPFGKVTKSVYTPLQGPSVDFVKWVRWSWEIAALASNPINRSSTAVCEPTKELELWRSPDGSSASVAERWDAVRTEEARAEEDMLDALLSFDLTIPMKAHILAETTIKGRILSIREWSPRILDPEVMLDIRDEE